MPTVSAPLSNMPTLEWVYSHLSYDPLAGIFTWLPAPKGERSNARYAGKIAGGKHNHGYLTICGYLAHRLAWLYVYGTGPTDQIDHINGIRSDNRIANLRQCSNAENCQNVKSHFDAVSAYVGVSMDRRRISKPWFAQICVSGRQKWLGSFSTEQEAADARSAAKAYYHAFNGGTRHADQ